MIHFEEGLPVEAHEVLNEKKDGGILKEYPLFCLVLSYLAHRWSIQ
jgi:hypothetical protein